jgi:hypothetical protein
MLSLQSTEGFLDEGREDQESAPRDMAGKPGLGDGVVTTFVSR